MSTQTAPIRVRPEIIEVIRKNLVVRNRLALVLNKSYPTIQRYFDGNDEMLTTAGALKVISEELGKTNEEILTVIA